MVNIAWKLDIQAVSAEYTVKLIAPAAVGKKLFVSAKIIATSSAKCVKIK